MNRFIFLILIFIVLPLIAHSQASPDFNTYFSNHTMRIDYFHTGDSKQEFISIDTIYRQGIWAGNPNHLIDNFDNAKYAESCPGVLELLRERLKTVNNN